MVPVVLSECLVVGGDAEPGAGGHDDSSGVGHVRNICATEYDFANPTSEPMRRLAICPFALRK